MTKFGFSTTAAEVAAGVDLNGKVAIVTGGYSGIGKETARVLATRGARVFVIGRDAQKCEQAVQDLRLDTGKQNISAMQMDLASMESIRHFVDEFNGFNIPVHFLINNAGVMCCPKGKTADGLETQFGTNHVGHFLLTTLLIPRLLEGAPSRVVTVSSNATYISGIRWKDVNFEKHSYGPWVAYGQSKTANILFAYELNRRYRERGITSNVVHPGIISTTNLQRHGLLSLELIKLLPKIMFTSGKLGKFGNKTIPQGAATTLYAALLPETEQGGKMYADCAEGPVPDYASDPKEAERLWELTSKIVGM